MTRLELARALSKEFRILEKPNQHSSEAVLAAAKRAWLAGQMFLLQMKVIDGGKE